MLFPMFANNPNKSPSPGFIEKCCYGLGDFSSCIMYAASQSILLYYYTEYVQVNIAIVATIMLISRFFDGASDLIVGYLVDRTKSGYGKSRAWILRMLIPYFLTAVLLFSVPMSWSEAAKLVYIFITYNLTITVVYTAINLPYGMLSALISKDTYERSIVAIYRVVFSTLGYTLTTAITLPMVRWFGNDNAAWTYTFIVLGGIATVLFFFCFYSCQERVTAPPYQKDENLTNKDKFRALFSNKYWIMLTLAMLFTFGADIIAGASSIYLFKYYLDDPEYIGTFAVLGTCIRFALMIFVLPWVLKKITKRNIIYLAIFFYITGHLVKFIDPYALYIHYTSAVFCALGATFLYPVMWGMVPDAIDYGEYNAKIRTEGLVYSGASFSTKVANGLGTVIVGFVINAGGYVNNAEVQTQDALDAILFASSGVPIIVFLMGAAALFFYNLDKEFPEVIRELNRRREVVNADDIDTAIEKVVANDKNKETSETTEKSNSDTTENKVEETTENKVEDTGDKKVEENNKKEETPKDKE